MSVENQYTPNLDTAHLEGCTAVHGSVSENGTIFQY